MTTQPLTATKAAPDSTGASLRFRTPRLGERVVTAYIYLCGLLSIVFVALIFLFVFREALPLLKEYSFGKFLAGKSWSPADDPPDFGLLPLLLSSLLVTLGAVVIAVPLGLATAIYIGEIAPPRLREFLKPLIEMLAAVPSVVLGFFGVVVLAAFLKDALHLGSIKTMLVGSITLAFMSVPTIATISEDAIAAVPREMREGSLGLGATRWQTLRYVLLPAALSGIVAAVMIGVGRAIGETMVVLMVTGNGIGLNLSALMEKPDSPLALFQHIFGTYLESCRTLTATIAAEMGEVVPGDSHYRALFLLGVVLFVITFILNAVARYALSKGKLQG